MSDVHLPRLEGTEDRHGAQRPRRKELLTILLEVVLISGGVFLGIAGEQWRENVHHHELARASLERFRAEMITNQKAINDVKDYHTRLFSDLNRYLNANTSTERAAASVHMTGLQPIFFEHTAWDVAAATQSLAYIDTDLVFSLSEVYNRQAAYTGLTDHLMQATYIRPLTENRDAFLRSVHAYLGDATYLEPAILKQYDDLLPRINKTLADSK